MDPFYMSIDVVCVCNTRPKCFRECIANDKHANELLLRVEGG